MVASGSIRVWLLIIGERKTLKMDTKPWWQSKAVWGGTVALISAVWQMVQAGQPTPDGMMAAAGAAMAVYGRIVAKTAIGSK